MDFRITRIPLSVSGTTWSSAKLALAPSSRSTRGRSGASASITSGHSLATRLDCLITETPDLEIIDQAAIDAAPEVAAKSKTAATIFVRVPADLKRRLDTGARREGKSTNAYALELFERVLELAEPAVHG